MNAGRPAAKGTTPTPTAGGTRRRALPTSGPAAPNAGRDSRTGTIPLCKTHPSTSMRRTEFRMASDKPVKSSLPSLKLGSNIKSFIIATGGFLRALVTVILPFCISPRLFHASADPGYSTYRCRSDAGRSGKSSNVNSRVHAQQRIPSATSIPTVTDIPVPSPTQTPLPTLTPTLEPMTRPTSAPTPTLEPAPSPAPVGDVPSETAATPLPSTAPVACSELMAESHWLSLDFWSYAYVSDVEAGLAYETDIEAKGELGWTLLHQALHVSQNQAVPLALLEAGADIEARDDHQWTPLHAAAFNYWGEMPILQALLDAGADTEARNNQGQIPLRLAAGYNGNLGAVQALLDAGAEVDVSGELEWTPLHLAAMFNEDPCSQPSLCWTPGTDTESRDLLGSTALHLGI